jgi:hypothetical protein
LRWIDLIRLWGLRHHIHILRLLIDNNRGGLIINILGHTLVFVVIIVVMTVVPTAASVFTIISSIISAVALFVPITVANLVATVRKALIGRNAITENGADSSACNFAVSLAKL